MKPLGTISRPLWLPAEYRESLSFLFLPKQRQAISWRGIFMKFSDNNISFNISFFSRAHFLQDQKITVIQAWRDLPFSIQGQYWISGTFVSWVLTTFKDKHLQLLTPVPGLLFPIHSSNILYAQSWDMLHQPVIKTCPLQWRLHVWGFLISRFKQLIFH